MCFRTARRSPPPARAALPLLALALAAAACGHKAPPVPPPRMIPATTAALKAHQRGMEAVLRFPHPTTTLRGAVLSGLAQVDVYQFTLELPADALELQRQEIREHEQRLAEYQEALAERQLQSAAEEGAAAAGEGGDEAPAATEPPPPTAEEERPGGAAGAEPPPEEVEVEGGEPGEEGKAAEEGEEGEAAEGGAGPGEAEEGETAEGEGEEDDSAEELRHPGTAPTLGDLVQIDPRSFEREATLVRSLAGEELATAILGADLLLRLPLAEPPAEGATGYAFAVRTTSLEGLPSSLSNFAKLVPQAPPPPPAELAIETQARGVELAWTTPEDPPEGFKVYRREAQSRAYAEAVAAPAATARSHVDYGAVLEARYIYAVTAVAQAEPLVESALSAEREVYYQDRFPPAAPGEVAAFPDAGAVRVLWEPPAEEDVVGYIVYRRREGGNAQALMEEPSELPEYIDREAPAGSILLYAVVAVDGHGNRSDASAEVRVRVP